MLIVSACLCGINCKYSGSHNFNEKVYKLFQEGKVIPLCPEQLGGLTTPRHPSEISEGDASSILNGCGRVINNKGEDVTEEFIKGAYETLKVAKSVDCSEAILKSNSPSCGFGEIYDGSFSGKLTKGNGITAQLLSENGIKVKTEKDI